MYKILALNPGSTSTKIAVYHDDKLVFVESMQHTAEQLAQYRHVTDQYPMRKSMILQCLTQAGIPMDFDAVIGRGPLCKPVEGGAYIVTADMVRQAAQAEHQHACDLGCILAYELAAESDGAASLTADPGVVDELCDEARICGSPLMHRTCIWHALNQRATARKYAASIGKTYQDLNLIVCHLGGGISVASHSHGRAIDANNALDGEGPFSPERAGTLPACDLVNLSYSGRYTREQLLKRIAGNAGVAAHLGTNDMKAVMRRVEQGDEYARLIVDAMAYHVAKAIAAEGAVLYGNIDAILLTGGMAHCQYIVDKVRQRVEFLAPVHIYPGENEMEALAMNALGVLRGEIHAKDY